MAKLGVRVLRSGAFLNEVYTAEPEATTRAVLQAAKDLKTPPYTVAELLHALREQGATTLVAQMSKALAVKPVERERMPKAICRIQREHKATVMRALQPIF